MFHVIKTKFLWSTCNPDDGSRRHTFKDRTDNNLGWKECLTEKRCLSMPSVSLTSTSSNCSTTSANTTAVQHRSRLLRLQDRRFRHRFPQVPQDEKLLNYFSCALVSDILLQGHLFITKNYFAFYSNIFGHKTQILINVVDVVKVTKEKIAKFIPNAVGVYTEADKFVFGSMLSRDSAFRIIQQTWIQSTDAGLGLPDDSDSETSPPLMLLGDEDSSVSSGLSSNLVSDDIPISVSDMATMPEVVAKSHLEGDHIKPSPIPATQKYVAHNKHRDVRITSPHFSLVKAYKVKIDSAVKVLSRLSRTSLLFMMSTILLIILFISTTVLLYRIHMLHQKLLAKDVYHTSSNIPSIAEFPHLLQSDFASVVSSLEERIKSLAEVRTTLEKIISMANKYQQVPRTTFSQCLT